MSGLLSLIPAMLLLLPSLVFALMPAGLEPKGSGTARYLGLIKVYDATLYASPEATVDNILGIEVSFCLQLRYAVDLSSESFIEAAETILARQHDPQTLRRVREGIELIHRSYRDVRSGDNYLLCYDDSVRQSSLVLSDEELVDQSGHL